jgi:polysaccharide pyruvyl transferase CsaB
LAVIREISSSDGLISGGGGLIQDVTSWKSPLYYLGIIALARLYRKKVFLYANGVGPLHYSLNRKVTNLVLNRVKNISVRDIDSQTLLSSLGVKHANVTIDPIFSLMQTDAVDSYTQYQDFIAVSFGPNKDTLANQTKIAQFLDFVSEQTDKTCLFTPFYPGFDRDFSKELKHKMKRKSVVIETFCPPEEMLSILKRCAFGIGMRLHFLIFLAILNKPMLPYLYDPKVKTFSDMLSLSSTLGKNNSFEEMKTILKPFLDNLSQQANFSPLVSSLRNQNRLNQDQLIQFCNFL